MMLVTLLVGLLASALFSGLETGLYTTSRLRLFLDEQAGVAAARRARELLRDMPALLTVLLVSNNLANWLASFSVQALLVAAGVAQSEVIGTVLVSTVLFVCSESVPKSAFRQGRERLLYPAMPLLVAVHTVLGRLVFPVTWFSERLTRRLRARAGARADERHDPVLATGVSEGFLTPFQERVARGVLAMRTRTAGEAALPLECFPRATLGRAGVELPPGSVEHRALVQDRPGGRLVGWLPLAALWTPSGPRPPHRRELQPLVRVPAGARLDSVYSELDRGSAPFAVLPDGRVLDGDRLRHAVMGLPEETGAALVFRVATLPERS